MFHQNVRSLVPVLLNFKLGTDTAELCLHKFKGFYGENFEEQDENIDICNNYYIVVLINRNRG